MVTNVSQSSASCISAVLILLLRRSRTGLPAVARSLLWGVAVGVGLAVIAWAARAMRGIPYLEPTGVSLSMTLVVSVAFCVGLAGTALVSGVLAARRSSRS